MDISALSQLTNVNTGFSITGDNAGNTPGTDGTSMFKDIYSDLIDNVNQTDSNLQADMVKLAEGELDNPQQLLIDSSKSAIALQLFSSVRNDALSAYNDIIKMQV